MKLWERLPRVRIVIAWLLAGFMLLPAVAGADTVVHGYNSKTAIQPGWVVALDKNSTDTVILAPASDSSRIFGVAIDPSSAPVTVQKQGQQIFVATSGSYPVLVSTENGPVKTGDYLSLSSTDGIAAKAKASQPVVVGRALSSFNGTSGTLLRTNNGAAIGQVVTALAVGANPAVSSQNAGLPKPLRDLSNSVAGKVVSPSKVYAALGIFLAGLAVATTLLLGGIRNGLLAIGRNPLGKPVILRGLAQVIAVGAFVLAISLFGIYLLLRA